MRSGKPKHRPKGIVLFIQASPGVPRYYRVGTQTEHLDWWPRGLAHDAGCPHLDSGELRKVRITIEEVTERKG